MAKILTDKHKRFADEYLIDLNGAQAAIRSGYSQKTARSIAAELLTKPDVQRYLAEKQEKLQRKTDVTQERVVNELAKIAFADITDYLEYHGRLGIPVVDVKDSSDVDGSPIQEVSLSKDGTFKFRLYSKLDALDKLFRHLGLYNGDSTVIADTLNENLESLKDLLQNPAPNRNLPDDE